MEVENEVQIKEFNLLLEELRKQILDASTYFDVMEQIWPTEQVVNVINRYKGFFQPVRQAILDQFSVKISNVISNDRRSPSFNRVFKMLDINPNLAPDIEVHLLRQRLKQHRTVLRAINHYRNTRAAHWDTYQMASHRPVLYGESKRMLKELQEMYNEICSAAVQTKWSFTVTQHGDINAILDHLNELIIIHKKRIDDLESNTKSE